MDEVGWIVRRISELGGFENVSDSVKADVFGFDIADVSGSIRMFSDVMKRLGIKLDGDELYEECQRIYDESVGRDVDKGKMEDKMRNRDRGRRFLCISTIHFTHPKYILQTRKQSQEVAIVIDDVVIL